MADDGNLANLDAMRAAQASSFNGGSSAFKTAEAAMFGGVSAPIAPTVKIPGVPSIGGVSLSAENKAPQVPTFKGELQNQFNALMDTARRTIRMKQNGVPIPKNDVRAQDDSLQPSVRTPQQLSEPQGGVDKPIVGGAVAQQNGVSMSRSMFDNGKEAPFYKRGETMVELPDGIDVNDNAAVQSAIDETNEVIGWMDELYA